MIFKSHRTKPGPLLVCALEPPGEAAPALASTGALDLGGLAWGPPSTLL